VPEDPLEEEKEASRVVFPNPSNREADSAQTEQTRLGNINRLSNTFLVLNLPRIRIYLQLLQHSHATRYCRDALGVN
jgi:hypothetical protein